MAKEKSDIEKKLEGVSLALRNKIETDALYNLTNKSWCEKYGVEFKKEFNPERNSGLVEYSDPRQRTAVEISYRETMELERREALEMYDYRKRLSRNPPKLPTQESEVWWV